MSKILIGFFKKFDFFYKGALISNHAILPLSSLAKNRVSDHVCMITFYSALMHIREKVNHARRKRINISDACRILISNWGSELFLITIADRVAIAPEVCIVTNDASTWLVKNYNNNRYQKYAALTIMPDVTIGSHVVTGAGSIFTKDIPSNSVAVGNPAKVVSDFNTLKNKIEKTCVNDKEIRHIIDYKHRVYKAIELSEKKNEK